jgi:uncharacterized protein (DUF1778 family)
MAHSADANIDRKGRRTRTHDVIRIRASSEIEAILQRAATLRGQTLSEFILDSARRQAEEIILDQRSFFLDAKAHAKFLELLDAPANPSAELRARVKRKPIWKD